MNQLFNSREPFSCKQFWFAFCFVTILALLLRLPTLASRSLWLDETYSAWFAALPLRELWTSVPLYETHPPVYYTLLKGWSVVTGTSEAALRSLSVAASVVSVMLLAASTRLLGLGGLAQRVSLLGGLFLACNAGSILFAQQARPYAIQTVVASVAVLCSLVILRGFGQNASDTGMKRTAKPWLWGVGLGLSAGCTLWMHNTGFFIALGIWAGLITATLLFARWKWRQSVLVCGAAGIAALLVWLPFLPTFLGQTAAMASMRYWLSFHLIDLAGAWALPLGSVYVAVPGGLLAAAGIARLWRTHRALACHILVVLLLAPLLMGAYSYFIKPIFIARLFAWLGPMLMGVVALGVFSLPVNWRAPVVGLMLALSAYSTYNFYQKPTENWRDMVAWIEERIQPGDLVVAVPNEIQLPVAYYGHDSKLGSHVVYLPAAFPARGLDREYVTNLGAPAVGRPDIQRLEALLTPGRRVWLMERRPDIFDRKRIVTATLNGRLTPIETLVGSAMTITLYSSRR